MLFSASFVHQVLVFFFSSCTKYLVSGDADGAGGDDAGGGDDDDKPNDDGGDVVNPNDDGAVEIRKLCPAELDTRVAEAGQCVDNR